MSAWSRREFLRGSLVAGTGLAAGIGFPKILTAQGREPIKVGILHSLSGTMAIRTTSLIGASLMAIVPLRECRIPTLIGSRPCAVRIFGKPIPAARPVPATSDPLRNSRRDQADMMSPFVFAGAPFSCRRAGLWDLDPSARRPCRAHEGRRCPLDRRLVARPVPKPASENSGSYLDGL